MGRSRGELLERARRRACRGSGRTCPHRPDDLAEDRRMPGEGPEAIPDGRFERVTKLVARRPPLDVDQLVALLLEQLDRVRAPAGASTARERNDGDRATPAAELVPDRRTPDQLWRPGRSRAAWTCEASRPVGVAQRSPAAALHFGHERSNQPRATWICGTTTARLRPPRPDRQRVHRAPGAAWHSGHHCSRQATQSLMTASSISPGLAGWTPEALETTPGALRARLPELPLGHRFGHRFPVARRLLLAHGGEAQTA